MDRLSIFWTQRYTEVVTILKRYVLLSLKNLLLTKGLFYKCVQLLVVGLMSTSRLI